MSTGPVSLTSNTSSFSATTTELSSRLFTKGSTVPIQTTSQPKISVTTKTLTHSSIQTASTNLHSTSSLTTNPVPITTPAIFVTSAPRPTTSLSVNYTSIQTDILTTESPPDGRANQTSLLTTSILTSKEPNSSYSSTGRMSSTAKFTYNSHVVPNGSTNLVNSSATTPSAFATTVRILDSSKEGSFMSFSGSTADTFLDASTIQLSSVSSESFSFMSEATSTGSTTQQPTYTFLNSSPTLSVATALYGLTNKLDIISTTTYPSSTVTLDINGSTDQMTSTSTDTLPALNGTTLFDSSTIHMNLNSTISKVTAYTRTNMAESTTSAIPLSFASSSTEGQIKGNYVETNLVTNYLKTTAMKHRTFSK